MRLASYWPVLTLLKARESSWEKDAEDGGRRGGGYAAAASVPRTHLVRV